MALAISRIRTLSHAPGIRFSRDAGVLAAGAAVMAIRFSPR
jgi:hypothetical protein